MSERPTFGSLFAGIGGIDLGLERAGWECRFTVEWDDWCRARLVERFPRVPDHFGDITRIDWSGVERVDLLAGGFPCQPVSAAGRQAAQADERWLWPEFHRAIRALRPRLVLVENVTNLLAVGDGSAFGDVLGDLAASGYDAEWDCLPAFSVGAPHGRDRVFLVAYPDGSERGSIAAGRDDADGNDSRRREAPSGSFASGEAMAYADSERRQGERSGGLSDVNDTPRGYDADRRSRTPDVADARRGSVWSDGGRGQAHGPSEAVEGAEDQRERSGYPTGRGGSPLAHPDRPRLEGRVFHPERGREWFAGPGGVADTDGLGRDGRTRLVGQGRRGEPSDGGRSRRATGEPSGRGAQPGLGGAVDGLPSWLDHPWPAPPGPQYEWEPPRVIAGRIPDRTRRLKALGNAVVPQIPELIGRWLRIA